MGSSVAFAKSNDDLVNVHGSVYQATYSQETYSSAEENSKTNINTEFERLQISIDKVLKVKDGRYIYIIQKKLK